MIQISDETDNNRPLFFCVLRSFHPKPTEIVTGNKHEKIGYLVDIDYFTG